MKTNELSEWITESIEAVAPERPVLFVFTGKQLGEVMSCSPDSARTGIRKLVQQRFLREVGGRKTRKSYIVTDTELYEGTPFNLNYGVVLPERAAQAVAEKVEQSSSGEPFVAALNNRFSTNFSSWSARMSERASYAMSAITELGANLEQFFDYVEQCGFGPDSMYLICSEAFIKGDFGVFLRGLTTDAPLLEQINKALGTQIQASAKTFSKVRKVRSALQRLERTEAQYLEYIARRDLNFNISTSETFMYGDFIVDVKAPLVEGQSAVEETFIEAFTRKARFCLASPNGRKEGLLFLTVPVISQLSVGNGVPTKLKELAELDGVPSAWLQSTEDGWKLTQIVADWILLLAVNFAVLRLNFAPIGYNWKVALADCFAEGVKL